LSDGAATALASALSAQLVIDKEEAKVLKKAGYRIAAVKNKTFRESNTSLRYINLSDNYVAEAGLQAWVDVVAEQVRLTPARGTVVQTDGTEVAALSLLPPHIQEADRAAAMLKQQQAAEAKAKEDAEAVTRASSATPGGAGSSRKARAAAAAAGGTSAAAGGKDVAASPSSKGSSTSAAALSDAAEKAAAAARAEEEASRFPGQQNVLVQVDLSNQHSRLSERLWHVLACSGPLIHWVRPGVEDSWRAEGNLDIRALDALAAEEAERARRAAQSDEERALEAQQATQAAEAAAAAALQAAQEAQEQKKSSSKAGSASGKKKAPPSAKSSARGGDHD
jgi:hypothetical protein